MLQLAIELSHHLLVPLPGQRTGDSVLLDNQAQLLHACILALVRPRPLTIVHLVLKMEDAQHSTTQEELECN